MTTSYCYDFYGQLEKNKLVKMTSKLQKGYVIFSLYQDMSDHDREAGFFSTGYNSALYEIGYCLLTSQTTFSSISHTPTSQPLSSESNLEPPSFSLY